MSYYNETKFIQNRKSFNVAPYALADAIEALLNDDDHFVDICVTKEDGRLVVMFNRIYKDKMIDDAGCTNDMPPNIEEKTDETTIHNS